MRRTTIIIYSMVLMAAVSGCATGEKPSPMPPMAQLQSYTEPEERYVNHGSLFSEASSNLLFEDSRARRVGDIILVKIVENTKAQNKADTSANRKTNMNLGVSSLFGAATVSPLLSNGPLKGSVGNTPIVAAGTTSDLSGTGETKRENTVSTVIGARVMQVLPNNILKVEGAREIRVNEETEYMVISGLVRSSDVLSDNSVLSTQLAESSISYYGQGVITDKQKPGWLTRLLDVIWPF